MRNRSSRRKPLAERLADRITPKGIRSLTYTFLEAINSPRSLAIYLIMRNTDDGLGLDDEILQLAVDPLWFNDVESFRDFHLPSEFVRKGDFLKLSWDPESKARETFYLAEQSCADSNRRLTLKADPTGRFETYLSRMCKDLSFLLGPVNLALLERVSMEGGWGSGVTSSCKGSWLSEYHKLLAKPEATQALGELGVSLWATLFPRLDRKIEFVEGSQLAFVPKSASTHRSIAVEPSVNAFLQRGIGLAIRRRLHRRWGLDLGQQTPNQELARKGSIDGSVATIDLASASDTLSLRAVERLLPEDWVALLRCCRCAFTLDPAYPEKFLFLNKWSSMGNGYTFELETAIFAAAVRAVVPKKSWVSGLCRVYGDDIIVETAYFQEVCDLLGYLGFSVNKKKTFSTSPFRESCGADFFSGVNVRPFYLKRSEWLQVVEFLNWVRTQFSNFSPKWKHVYTRGRRLLGKDCPLVPAGPHGLAGLWEDSDYSSANLTWKQGMLGFEFSGLAWQPRVFPSERIEGYEAMYAHLRQLLRMNVSPSYDRGDVELSEPWRLTAKGEGRWVTRRVWFEAARCPTLPTI